MLRPKHELLFVCCINLGHFTHKLLTMLTHRNAKILKFKGASMKEYSTLSLYFI